jgi:hypothetical protein
MRAKKISTEEIEQAEYAMLISALGFESRATAVANRISSRCINKIALGFDHNHDCSYFKNEEWFRQNGFEILPDLSSSDFSAALIQYTDALLILLLDQKKEAEAKIAIDISCFDRRRLADIVQWVCSMKIPGLVVDFWYCIAEFQPPNPTVGRNEIAGPVHRKFAGRFTEPGRPLALVAGLGYELGRVMGAAEYLQASKVVAFVPESPVIEYEGEVLAANETMLNELEPRQVLRYPVADPGRTLAMLDSAIRGLREHYNVVLLPGGPKLFALCSLIACTIHRDAAVWRVSSGGSIKPRDILPSCHFVGMRLRLNEPDSHMV